jgi:hypothetical protein
MKQHKVKVGNRTGWTTSVIPHSTGCYPVWFDGTGAIEFILASDVEFTETKNTDKNE